MFNIKKFVEENPRLVTRRESKRYPGLFVLKYHNRVFYDNLWTTELQEMRGLVVDEDYNIVVYPFTKVFNRFENGMDIALDEQVVAVRKINGFLGCITLTKKYGLIVSTTGSLDSDFVEIAGKHLRGLESRGLVYDSTYMFEVCDESDPHIIKETLGAYLIGCRNVKTGEMISEEGLDIIANGLGVKRPYWFRATFGDVVREVKTCQHEGFMVYGKDKSLKIKSPYYLVKKLFARINVNKITDQWLLSCKEKLDEEYYPLVDHLYEHREHFFALDQQNRLSFIENFLNK